MGAIIGLIIMIVGVILFIGNVSGWWVTFPYAGFILMSLGVLVVKGSRDK